MNEEMLAELRARLINVELKIDSLLGPRGGPLKSVPPSGSQPEARAHPDQRYGRLTFAQHGEDLLILTIFDLLGIERPTYLDVGAHHPFNISNTALLHMRGCRGINVEANPNLFAEFLNERPDDINLNVGAGVRSGQMTFYMVDKWSGRNSFDKSVVDDFVKAYPEFSLTETLEIPVVTLNDIVKTYANNEFPNFLSIDVEGLDDEILRSVDFSVSKPIVICVETVDSAGRDASTGLVAYLATQGYFRLLRSVGNSIFVQEQYRSTLL